MLSALLRGGGVRTVSALCFGFNVECAWVPRLYGVI